MTLVKQDDLKRKDSLTFCVMKNLLDGIGGLSLKLKRLLELKNLSLECLIRVLKLLVLLLEGRSLVFEGRCLDLERFERLEVLEECFGFCWRWMSKVSQAVDVVLVEFELEPVVESLVLAVGILVHIMQCHASCRSLEEHGGLSWSSVRICLNEWHHDPRLNVQDSHGFPT